MLIGLLILSSGSMVNFGAIIPAPGITINNFPRGAAPAPGKVLGAAVPAPVPRVISFEALEPPGVPAGIQVVSAPAVVNAVVAGVVHMWHIMVTVDNDQPNPLLNVTLLIEFANDNRDPAGCPGPPIGIGMNGLGVANNQVRADLPPAAIGLCIPAFFIGTLAADDGDGGGQNGGPDEVTVQVVFTMDVMGAAPVPLPAACDPNGNNIPEQFEAGGGGALASSPGIVTPEAGPCSLINGPLSNMSVLAEIHIPTECSLPPTEHSNFAEFLGPSTVVRSSLSGSMGFEFEENLAVILQLLLQGTPVTVNGQTTGDLTFVLSPNPVPLGRAEPPPLDPEKLRGTIDFNLTLSLGNFADQRPFLIPAQMIFFARGSLISGTISGVLPSEIPILGGSLMLVPFHCVITVPIVQQRRIQVEHDRLIFWQVATVEGRDLPLRIANTGNLPLRIVEIRASPPFSASIETQTIAPQGVAVATIRFESSVPGSFQGTVRIVSDDPITPILDIPVEGIAVEVMEVPLDKTVKVVATEILRTVNERFVDVNYELEVPPVGPTTIKAGLKLSVSEGLPEGTIVEFTNDTIPLLGLRELSHLTLQIPRVTV